MSDDPMSLETNGPVDEEQSRRNAGHYRAGISGNPKGRPRKARSNLTVTEQAFLDPVEITIKGKKKSVSYIEALLLSLKQQALKGSIKAAELLLKQCPPSVMEKINSTAAEDRKRSDEAFHFLLASMDYETLAGFRKAHLLMCEKYPDNYERSRMKIGQRGL